MLRSELHDATLRILCEKNYGPLNMGTVIIAQKGMMISFYDKKNTYCIKSILLGCKLVYDAIVNINFVCI